MYQLQVFYVMIMYQLQVDYVHRCTQGVGKGGWGVWNSTPRQIFKKLINKNAIKPKIGGPPPRQFFLKPLTPPPLGILAKTSSPPPGFSARVHLWLCVVSIHPISIHSRWAGHKIRASREGSTNAKTVQNK